MLEAYRIILDILDRGERIRFFGMLFLVFLLAVFAATSVISILPFLQILTDPTMIQTNRGTAWLYRVGGFTSQDSFIRAFGLLVFVITVVGIIFRNLMAYILIHYSLIRAYRMSARLFARYLNQPYIWFVSRQSSDINYAVLSEVDQVVRGGMLPALRFFPSLVTVLLLVGFLFLIEPVIACLAFVVLGGSYGVSYLLVRRILARLGERRRRTNQRRFHVVQEATGGVKELKLMGLEAGFLGAFRIAAHRMVRAQTRTELIKQVPKFVLEVTVFGGLIVIVLTMLAQGQDMADSIPTLGTIALAANRLMPTLQATFNQVASVQSTLPALQALHKDFVGLKEGHDQSRISHASTEQIPLTQEFVLQNVHYQYEGADRAAVEGLNLTIKKGETIGIVGGTGAGKTTLVDLIVGLLQPDQGAIRIDGKVLDSQNIRNWQTRLGYIPQHVFLSDNSIAENIAFGRQNNKIDQDAVIRAAKAACLHDFIETELPEGYGTLTGERGVRLSGGQRQRIGIARALYHNPDLLIMDEATSALDNLTEQAVMEAVHDLAGDKTILMIAHRLTTVVNCDRILLLEHGRIVAEGSYDELLERSEQFRAMTLT